MKKYSSAFCYLLVKETTISERKKAFTLVELIIVITILAILATIAFVSFSNYAKESRDAQRLSSLTNIEKGIDVYGIEVGRFPIPENPTSFTGGTNSEIKQGILTKNVLPNLSSTPVDPVSGKNYTYSVFGNGKYYQIATDLENELSHSLGTRAYANTFKTTKLAGNYRYDPSLPSLIIGSGTNIFSPDTCFVTNGGTDTLENCITKKSDFAGKNTDSSLVGYWDMETLSGALLKDLSGNGNDGSFSGIANPNSTGGFLGKAYNFLDVNNSFVNIPTSQSLEITGALTLSVIIKANKNELKGILSKQSTGNASDAGSTCSPTSYCGYHLASAINELGGRVYDVNYFGEMNSAGTSLTTDRTRRGKNIDYIGKFVHLTYTVSNGTLAKVYMNGIEVRDYNGNKLLREISVSKNPLRIGRYWNDYNGGLYEFFDGIIDEVKIYNRALSDEEILQQARIAGF